MDKSKVSVILKVINDILKVVAGAFLGSMAGTSL